MRSLLHRWLPPQLLLVLGIFVAVVSVVMATGVAPMVDEWVYIDAAETFARESTVRIAPLSFAPAVFEAVFGGLVIEVFGESLAVLVAATGGLSLIGGIALWDLLRRSRATQFLAAISTAAFLFSSLFFGLSVTYMTDAHAVALAVVAVAMCSRGVDEHRMGKVWLLGGAVVATVGFFSRPGVLLAMTGALIVLIQRKRFLVAALAATVPALVVGQHLLFSTTGVVDAEGVGALARISMPSAFTFGQVLITTAVTIGVFMIPIAPMIIREVWSSASSTRTKVLGGVVGVFVLMILLGTPPILGNWFNVTGLFPIDESTIGTRVSLVNGPTYLIVVVLALIVGASAVTLVIRAQPRPRLRSAEIGMWIFALGSMTLVILTSVAAWGRMLDRYLVVLLPALLLSLTPEMNVNTHGSKRLAGRLSIATTALVIGVTSVLAVDGMRLQRSIFDLAEAAVSSGVPAHEVDGGAAWVGFQFGLDMAPGAEPSRREDWWRVTFAPDITPRYFVALNSKSDDCSVTDVNVDSVLGSDNSLSLVDSECRRP